MNHPSTETKPGKLPVIADELAWELLRDEWDLLLAIGNGPTGVDAVAERLGQSREDLLERLQLLHDHGLVYREGEAFGLVLAVHERQEGMASFLRDLVIKRLQLGNEVPFAVGYRNHLGDGDAMTTFLSRADADLFPPVFDVLQAPAGDEQPQAVTFIFAAASEPVEAEHESDLEGFMNVLKAAASERAVESTRERSDLKLADTRNSMADVERVAQLCDDFFAQTADHGGRGAAAYALLLRPVNCAS